LGTVAQWTGHVGEATLAFERAIGLKERAGTEASALLTYNNLGALLLAVGRLDDAERVFARCLSGSSSPILAEVARANVGDLNALRGRFDAAVDAYRKSLAFCRKQAFTTQQSHVLSGLIRTLLMRGGPAMSEVESLAAELETLTGTGVAEAERRFHTARAAWLDVTGQTRDAYDAVERAVHAVDRRTLFSDVFGTHLDAAWLRALLLSRLGRRRSAERALGSCRKTLAQLGAKVGGVEAQRAFVLGHPVHRAIDRGDLSLPPGFTFRMDAPAQAS
jgi:tetratricopeptide (TPR) repeat protein